MSNVRAALDKIAERRPSLIDLSLGRVHRALALLGEPHKRLPPVIHVAGTNGKGSTIAYMREILEAAGKRVHVFTSPHLVRYNERIILSGQEISDETLIDVIERCDRIVGEEALTFFETFTCAAFLAFSESPADNLLLEVGLGGRLDATNVIDQCLASVITPIALDHQHFLGDDLTAIAGEKAGIFRPGVPAVIAPQSAEAMAVFNARSLAEGAKLHAFGSDWDARVEHGRLIYQDDNGLSDLRPPRLAGAHQAMNAGLAVAALKAAGIAPDDETISTGIEAAHWPARLQRLKKGPLIDQVDRLSPGSELWLDGGHNPHAARAVAASLGEMEERSPRPLVLIVGMQTKKDAAGFFAAFEGMAALVLTVASGHQGAAPAEDVADAAMKAGLAARTCDRVEEALAIAATASLNEKSADEIDAPSRILICGSLYLAGEILANNA